MIAPPRRAVTRFFIPMIDVLILLFCIFLLMPFVSAPEAKEEPGADTAAKPSELEQAKRDLAMAQRRLAEAKARQANLFDQYQVTILEIDADTGRLYRSGADDRRQEIATAADAERLIVTERARAGGRDISILMLYPRRLTGFPEEPQVQQYRKWFRSVPHAIDIPQTTGE